MCNWRKPILCLLCLLLFLSSSHLTSSFWAFEQHLQKLCTFYIWELEQHPAELFKRLLCSEFAARTLLSSQICCENFSLVNLLWGTSLFWICLRELLLSSGFACENFFSLLDFAVRTVSPLGKQAQTLLTFQVRNHSWASMSVCCIPPHCKLPASNLLAPSEATTFQIILLPLLLPCTKSFLNRPSSLVSAPNKTTTRPPPNPPYPQTMSTARELEDLSLSLSLSLSRRVPLSLNFSLSQIAWELIAEFKKTSRSPLTRETSFLQLSSLRSQKKMIAEEVVQEDVQESVNKRNEVSSNLFTTAIVVVRERERESFVLAFPLWRKQKSQ